MLVVCGQFVVLLYLVFAAPRLLLFIAYVLISVSLALYRQLELGFSHQKKRMQLNGSIRLIFSTPSRTFVKASHQPKVLLNFPSRWTQSHPACLLG
jgi:hypothetical protein